MSEQKIILFIVVIAIVAGIIILAGLNYSPKTDNFTEKEIETTEKESETEEKIQEKDEQQLPEEPGKEPEEVEEEEYGFNVSSAAELYPKFISGKFSKRPSEVKGGETFNVSIKTEDPDGISMAKMTVVGQEESLREEVRFELVTGDEFSGTWEGSLIIPQEITRISWTNIYIQNKSGKENKLEFKW